ncbi:hypothetical protein KCU88_g2708, partial [Aureobasidium melanogenum]
MSRQVPRLRLFGGDHRSTVWFGLARLLMPDEYRRVEAIRRSRRERAKREKEKAVAEEASAGEDAGGVTAMDANAATGDESTNGAANAAVRSDAGGGAEGNDGGGKADEPSADGTPEGAEEPDNHQDHNSDGEPVEHGAAPSDTGDLPQAEPSDDQGTSRNGNDTEPDGTGEQPPSQHGSGSALAYQYHSVLVGQDQHHGYTYHRQMMQYQQGHGHSLYMAAETMQFGPSSVPAYAAVPALHHPEQFYHS